MLRRIVNMTRARYIACRRGRVRDGPHVGFFGCHIPGMQSFQENRHVSIHLLVVHNPLLPLIGRLVVVACSPRTRMDRRTDRQIDC